MAAEQVKDHPLEFYQRLAQDSAIEAVRFQRGRGAGAISPRRFLAQDPPTHLEPLEAALRYVQLNPRVEMAVIVVPNIGLTTKQVFSFDGDTRALERELRECLVDLRSVRSGRFAGLLEGLALMVRSLWPRKRVIS